MSPFQKHLNKWSKCTDCGLCKTRTKVVLGKGQIPCHVLMIGEGPGASEDVIGKPFVGPAGKLLDLQIKAALEEQGLVNGEIRIAMTNLVCCLPADDKFHKKGEPTKEEIEACSSRLWDFIELAQPKVIVAVGILSEKWLKIWKFDEDYKVIKIDHPAFILRQDKGQQGFTHQQCIIRLSDVFEEVAECIQSS